MKKSIFLLLVFACSLGGYSPNLYDINTFQDIRIVFAESNWDALTQQSALIIYS